MFRNYVLCLYFFLAFASLEATPSSLFWTNCSTDVLPTGKSHLDIDNYSALSNRGPLSSFPPDLGVLFGLFSWKNLSAEAGVDYLGGVDNPLYLNAKIGMEEEKLFPYAPSFNLGVFNVGTKTHGKDRTGENIVDCVIGHSLSDWIGGELYIGAFSGSKAMGKNRQGGMIGYTRSFYPALDSKNQQYFKWAFSADYATGKNSIGGGGFALSYYWTPTISIETGPVWFNSKTINGSWKWSLQVDIDM